MLEESSFDVPVLFHLTDYYNAYNILKTDSLELPFTETNKSEKDVVEKTGFKSKLFYLSFARNISSGYIGDKGLGNSKSRGVVFIFDEQSLKKIRGVTIKPVNYWTSDTTGRQLGRGREQEERLFSDNSVIKGILKSIIEIRILVDDDILSNSKVGYDYFNKIRKYVRSILILSKKNNIKNTAYLTSQYKNFLVGKENTSTRKNLLSNLKTESSPEYSPVSMKGNKKYDRDIQELQEFVYAKKYEDLTKQARSALYYVVEINDPSAWTNLTNRYSSMIHNMRNSTSERSKQDKQSFIRMMKYLKAKSIDDAFKKIYHRAWKLIDDYNKG